MSPNNKTDFRRFKVSWIEFTFVLIGVSTFTSWLFRVEEKIEGRR